MKKPLIILLGLALMFAIFFAPNAVGLTSAGKATLGVLVFAVVMWVTEAVSYPVSAVAIISFLILLLGFSPAKGIEGALLGTSKAIPMALSGFVNGGWVLVAAGLFMAAGIVSTGLEKRIAYNILKIVGTKVNNIFAGVIVAITLLGFLIPSITARSATMTPIAVGLVAAFGADKKSLFARMLLVTVAIVTSLSGILLLSSGAPNPVGVSFITKELHHTITWMDWFIYGAPFCIVLEIIFYFIVTRMNKFEFAEVVGGKEIINKKLAELGPMSANERRISLIFAITILLWATDTIHHIDANTVAILSVLMMVFPYVGVSDWKGMSSRVDWGTILLFGAGISLGEVLLSSGAALWLAKTALGGLGLGSMIPGVMMLVIVAALTLIRFAFASITAATAALVPTVIGFLLSLNNPSLPMWGMTFIATIAVYFAFILPVNSPQAMIAYATDTFEVKDMAKMGIPMTIASLIVLGIFVFTYWSWMGLLTMQ
jgi:anion transporter